MVPELGLGRLAEFVTFCFFPVEGGVSKLSRLSAAPVQSQESTSTRVRFASSQFLLPTFSADDNDEQQIEKALHQRTKQ